MLFDLVEAHGSSVLTDFVELLLSDFLLWFQVLLLKLFLFYFENGLFPMILRQHLLRSFFSFLHLFLFFLSFLVSLLYPLDGFLFFSHVSHSLRFFQLRLTLLLLLLELCLSFLPPFLKEYPLLLHMPYVIFRYLCFLCLQSIVTCIHVFH